MQTWIRNGNSWIHTFLESEKYWFSTYISKSLKSAADKAFSDRPEFTTEIQRSLAQLKTIGELIDHQLAEKTHRSSSASGESRDSQMQSVLCSIFAMTSIIYSLRENERNLPSNLPTTDFILS